MPGKFRLNFLISIPVARALLEKEGDTEGFFSSIFSRQQLPLWVRFEGGGESIITR